MKSENETILLRDKEIEPTDEVLENALGKKLFTIYQELIQIFTDEFSLELQWRFYKDGKSWLCKVVYKKKTVLWLSVWENYIKTGFYFTEKTRNGVLELGMNEEDMMEDDGYGIDVLDSVSADFDIDGDGISSKIDNVYGDGEGLDDLDLDIDFFSEPGIAPSKPGTKDPIIKPKTPPKRGPWTKPKTRPNPKAVREGDNMSKPKKRSFRKKGFYR